MVSERGSSPPSEIEMLTECLASILGVGITPHTSLFAAGGTSMHAEIFAREATTLLARQVTFTDVFLHPSPERLADALVRSSARSRPSLPAASFVATDWHPLSESQMARLAGQERSGTGLSPATRPQLMIHGLDLRGQLDIRAFRQAVRSTVERYESLRSRIGRVDGEWRLTVNESTYGPVEIDGRGPGYDGVTRLLRTPLPLDVGTMGRFVIVDHAPDHYECWSVIEHFVSDRVASHIIRADLAKAYSSLVTGGAPPNAPDALPSFAWPYYEQEACRSARGTEAEAFWLDTFGGQIARGVSLPHQEPYDPRRGWQVRRRVALGPGTRQALRRTARTFQTTVHALVVCAVARAVAALSQQQDVSVYWYAANRDIPNASRTTTWTALLTGIRLPAISPDLSTSLSDTAERVASAMAYSFYPLVRVARVHEYEDRFPPYESPRLLVSVDDDPEDVPGPSPVEFHGLEAKQISLSEATTHGYSIDTHVGYLRDSIYLELTHREEILTPRDSEELLQVIADEVHLLSELGELSSRLNPGAREGGQTCAP